METVQFVIEPQRICPCGKSYLPLSVEERRAYDEAIRRKDDARGEPPSDKNKEQSAELTYCK